MYRLIIAVIIIGAVLFMFGQAKGTSTGAAGAGAASALPAGYRSNPPSGPNAT